MTDPIADMITRIKNAYAARATEVVLPTSGVKKALADLLVTEKYLDSVELIEAKPQGTLKLKLRYVGKRPALTDVKRVSKPGRRVYTGSKNIDRTLGGYGVTILSTSMGLMNDKEAKAKHIGGEVICKIW